MRLITSNTVRLPFLPLKFPWPSYLLLVNVVLGYGFESPPKTLLANQRPFIQLLSDDGKVLEDKHPKNSDDTIFLIGTLSTGIPLSFSLRGGKAFKGTPGLEWRIYGERGEIKITASGPFLQIGYPDMKIEVHDFEKDTVEEVTIPTDELDGFGIPARNVARVYKGFVEGKINCTFEDAVERHRLIDEMYTENGYNA
jgi:predicted dehydrogenase